MHPETEISYTRRSLRDKLFIEKSRYRIQTRKGFYQTAGCPESASCLLERKNKGRYNKRRIGKKGGGKKKGIIS